MPLIESFSTGLFLVNNRCLQHVNVHIYDRVQFKYNQTAEYIKQRLLKAAVSKQPHILATVDNQQIKDLIQQVVSGDDPSMLNFDQIQAINEWLEQLDDSRNDHKSRKGPFCRTFSTNIEADKAFLLVYEMRAADSI
ncbi:unnamed protein product [Toxocara canis]|uniref:RNA polymerase II transcription factor B subunit 5 n=1 Tax=Toxocara canis TaxID=6265 RepID=A0A183V4R9_TOXCA|nr:unnamed protein product [Toxocara canis]